MRQPNVQRWHVSEVLISLFVFFVLAFYTYAILFIAPYPGFFFNHTTGRIVEIYSSSTQSPTLQVGDILKKIGDISWEEYVNNLRVVFFEGVEAGEIVEITVNRNGKDIVIQWEFAGFDQAVFETRILNIWILSFFFWFSGTVALISIRPRDTIRNLFIALNYLTALWVIFGSLASRHIWESSILVKAFTWLLLPVYLHFHWIFPRPLKSLSKTFVILFYLICSCFAIAEFFQVLPKSLYALVFIVALLGSSIIQVIHYRKHNEQRRDIKLIAIAIAIAFLPPILLAFLTAINSAPNIAALGLFTLPFMPLAYFYVISRRSMGGLEIRLNRIISLYLFFILLGIILFITIIPLTNLNLQIENVLIIGILVILAIVFIAINTFSNFQKFVEKRYLGISINTEKLAQSFSNLIVTNTTMPSLLRMLETDVFPSLLIRQYAFVQVENHHLHPLLMKQVTQAQLPEKEAISNLHELAGKFIPNLPPTDDWLRLILPLKLGDKTLGFFLLGSRDPDDIYHQQEIPDLQTIANQTAVALSNITRAETLREMYKSGVDRYEQERLRLSHDLHDIVLHELSELHKKLGEPVPANIQTSYEEIRDHLREIVNDVRPPMLMYGLNAGISGLAENIMQKTVDRIKVIVEIQATDDRLPENIEIHLFRIVQEACKNSLDHAHASQIKIYGSLSAQQVNLTVEDNGIGFDLHGKWNLETILANRHFGLVGMLERAHIMGAILNLQSKPNQGTKIQIEWAEKLY